MKRIAGLLAVLILSACTPGQGTRWLNEWLNASPEKQALMEQKLQEYELAKADATAGRPCAEWYDDAYEAGFTPEQWKYPLSMIMHRESNCIPTAQNRSSTAAGLTQIVVGTWRASCPDLSWADRYDGPTNLRCAFQVWLRRPNWRAWATFP